MRIDEPPGQPGQVPEAAEAGPATVEVSGYQVLALVARDGFAETFQALRTLGEGEVVLTVLVPELATAEVRRGLNRYWLGSQRLNDQLHLQQVVDAGATLGGRPYVVTEPCPGGCLGDRLTAHGPLTFPEVGAAAVPIALTLHAIHESGLWYGTVLPDDILVRDDGQPMLADLPTAALRAQYAAALPHTAPELAEGEEHSPASDIFSFAATLVHLLTGRPPLPAAPLPLSADVVPEALRQVLAAALDPDPDARPDALDFAEQLRVALVEQGQPVPAVPWPQRPARRPRRPPPAVAGVAAPAPAVAAPAPVAAAVADPAPPMALASGGGWTDAGLIFPTPAQWSTNPVSVPPSPSPFTSPTSPTLPTWAARWFGRRWLVPAVATGVLLAGLTTVAAIAIARGRAADAAEVSGADAPVQTVVLAPPTSVTVTGEGDTALLQWRVPPGQESNYVVVQVEPPPGGLAPLTILDPGTTTMTVTNLDPFGRYCFRVGIATSTPSAQAPAWADPVGLRAACNAD